MIIPVAQKLQQVEEYYFSRKLQEIRHMNAQGQDVINLGIGSPDLAPASDVVDALCRSAAVEQNHGYQPYRGLSSLRESMANWYASTFGVTLDPENQLLPLIGSKEGIFHISMAFLNPGDAVLAPNPGYPGYAGTTRLVGAEPIFYPLDPREQWQPDWEFLENLDTDTVKIMWINYPHMPTGAVALESTFRRLVDWCKERSILLCHDNPYSLILNPTTPLSILATRGALGNCLELNSLSKGHHMAGWRIGMVCGSSEYMDAIIQVKSNIDSGMFKGLQEAAITALQPRSSWHHTQNGIYQKRKILVETLMDILGCSYQRETAGLFVWAKVPDGVKDTNVFTDQILHQAKVFIVPGEVFGSAGKNYVRASLCVKEDRINQAIERIKALKSSLV
ncbi:MAG: aminotransferase class I/II-fold pyridoxal phosphate-dependent enzyme [Cyclobacteriaceae bacterium]|nr:aminotransferase class I/II-fold pyridoxal phosphate-dependent enzyme [Cyclobacteriaceae bacterium]